MSSKSSVKALKPSFELEDAHGGIVCGLDEVGRGPLAGPVVAACVIIPADKRGLSFTTDIRDSKKIPKPKLQALFDHIQEHFVCSIAEVSVEEIDAINILQASLKAMQMAYLEADLALVDGNRCPKLPCKTQAVIGGDNKSVSIAAASIVAKVHRDRLMKKLAQDHPYYGWESNAGYGAAAHMAGIEKHGITPHHRKSFAPIRNFIAFGNIRGSLKEAS